MCGIVGYVGTQLATEILLSGLEKLEYRGYDSAGVATICNGQIKSVRAKGKLYNLREKLAGVEMLANVGIGHTRWATHGKPEEYNAHPHTDDTERVAVVENGIVENYRELRKELESQGHKFVSETDTEVIPHLIAEFLSNFAGNEKGRTKNRENFLEAVRQTVNKLDGAFAIAVVCADYPNEIIVARQQAPISIGLGQGEFFCASDTPALISHTQVVVSLDNGEMARLTPLGVEVYNFDGDRINKLPRILNWSPNLVDKNIFKHFMLKEIHEQPNVIRNCLETYINSDWDVKNIQISPTNLNLSSSLYKNLEQVEIFACGTSWHASLIGKYLLEQLAGISTTVNYASEARYAPSPLRANTLTIGVTQSGETADTLAALAIEQQRRLDKPVEFTSRLLGITNRVESSIASLVHQIIDIRAGVEIGVAATKTFVAQVIAFYFLAIDLGWQRKYLSGEKIAEIINGLQKIPAQMEQILDSQNSQIEDFAHQFNNTQDLIFIGRGINYPIALEGALKLKEISYIHAEGYPAGEMKHGPIALLDDQVPVVAIAMPGLVYEKVLSNAQEAKARDAQLIGVTPESTEVDMFDNVLAVPAVDELLSPMLTVIPLQLLAYHIAAHRGLDVDQPRNLAKSVTVE
ncbi:glutamine--fructose-6-phosphate transaminase (isomerizing) [Trichodesmium erythraeum 21-75]|nr:glutamine--fructose-6-phosphate transaminase (isomerizing) [Trichodesmium erythraeum 21-75]